MSLVTNKKDLENLRKSGKILAQALKEAIKHAKPGATTMELNNAAEKVIREAGGSPAFLGYNGGDAAQSAFPCAMCTSVNDHVVHAVPSESVVLKDGDVVGMDLGVNYEGMITDHAVTVGVGKVSEKRQKLIDVTRESLQKALRVVKAGVHVGDIGEAVQTYVESNGLSIVRQLVGHGVGYTLHEEPKIPNFGKKGTGPQLEEGMVVAIEPMVNMGEHDVIFDGEWTVRTSDGSLSAHFEHTIRVTKEGCEILTQS